MSDAISREAALECFMGYDRIGDIKDAIAALPDVTPGVRVDIDELAYRFWSIHPKEIPETIGMPEGYKGGRRAWFYATEMRKMIAALDLTPQPAPAMRPETDMEHIARDMRDGRFPKRSQRQMVLVDPQPAPDVAGLERLNLILISGAVTSNGVLYSSQEATEMLDIVRAALAAMEWKP